MITDRETEKETTFAFNTIKNKDNIEKYYWSS